MRPHVKLVALMLVGALPFALASRPASAMHSDPARRDALCFGHSPTIIGSPGEKIIGTEGPDVVLTNGAFAADTLGGDDLLCVDKVADPGDEFLMATGPGNDRIDATHAGGGYFSLGPGADAFTGSDDGFDTVAADDAAAGEPDSDVIHTGDASDEVTSSGADTVDLGGWTDMLRVVGDPSGGHYTGGSDRDVFYLDVPSGQVAASWTLNSRVGELRVDGRQAAEFDGFQEFGASGPRTFAFIGSARREMFNMTVSFPTSGWLARHSHVDVRMGGGKDRVHFYGGAPGSRFDGGPGKDLFYYYRNYPRLPRFTTIRFDLASGALVDRWRGGAAKRRAANFEDAKIFPNGRRAGPITIKGTNAPNRLKGVSAKFPWDVPVSIFGRGGNDELMGSRGNDTLIGGAGHDVATGRSGVDRCRAEATSDCES
jgi:Ca2+-binding RTX toxin-like protein